MLDGKFSVYNGNDNAGPPPAEIKKASPVNFKYESLQSAALSFDDELRLAMEKFHRAKQPSALKLSMQKWIEQGSAMLFSSKEETKKAPTKATKNQTLKDPLEPYIKAFEQKSENFKKSLSSWVKILDGPDVKLPALKIPKIAVNLPTEKMVREFENAANKVEKPLIAGYKKLANNAQTVQTVVANLTEKALSQLESLANKIEKPILRSYERTKELYEDLKEKLEEILNAIYDKIPFEKLNDMALFIQNIPQAYIVPAALWFASYIPVERIKNTYEYGTEKIVRFMSFVGSFVKGAYSYSESLIKKIALYIYNNYLIPFSKTIDSLLTWLWNQFIYFVKMIYPTIKQVGIFLYSNIRSLPKNTYQLCKGFIRGIGRLTIWIFTRVAQ